MPIPDLSHWQARNTPAPAPDSQKVQDHLVAAEGASLGDKSPEFARRWFQDHFGRFDMAEKPPVGQVEDTVITVRHSGGEAELGMRLYRPKGAGAEPLPAYLHCHAGAYVAGDLDLLDSFCRIMCEGARCLVAAVDYRRAPEAKFPLPLEDCYSALTWLADNAATLGIDPARLAIGGDSSGGTLATATCQLVRDRGAPDLCHQLLWYPGVGSLGPTESETAFGADYFPQTKLGKWSMMNYLPAGADPTNPLVQPILLDDMAGLPPAFIMTAGFDGRRDANLQYAERLRDAGVPTEFYCLDSTLHGFLFLLGGISVARQAADFSAAYLAKVFGT